MTITAIRTVIIYIFLIAAMRIMGKRQLGELQPVELVVTLLISDLAAVPMQESGMPLLVGLVPIFVLVAMELLLSGLMLKVPWVSRMISGNPIVIVNNGKLDQKALKRLRLTLDDLMESLRQLNYFDLRDIQYAVAETNGKISVFPMPAKQPVTCGDVDRVPQDTGMPVVVISDGKISQWAMELLGLTEEWVRDILIRNNVAEDAYRADDLEECRQLAEQFTQEFQQRTRYFPFFMRHGDIWAIEETVIALPIYLETDDLQHFLSELAKCRSQLEKLYPLELPLPENIL